MYLSNTQFKKFESLQGTHLSVHNYHSKLIRAMNIVPVEKIIRNSVCGLWHRLFMVDSPMRDLCSQFMDRYIVSDSICHKTMYYRVLKLGISPLPCSLNANAYKSPTIF